MIPAGNHERDIGETVRGHSAVCAMVISFAAWKHMCFNVKYVGRSTKPSPHAHCVCTACTAFGTPSWTVFSSQKELWNQGLVLAHGHE